MKLLGWMPRKLKQHSIDTLKNFTIGNSCTCLSAQALLDEQQFYQQPIMRPKSSISVKNNTEEEVFEEESSIMTSNLFHGFLTIGTLGSEPITTEPTTPKFPVSFENVVEKETEVTENELKLINDELEKFFEAEAEEEGNESSERSSYASIITLGGKQIEVADDEEYENMVVCPLQGYLFGSSIELPETGVEVKKEKTSLGELFKNNNLGNEQHTWQSDKGEDKRSKGTYGTHFMKKMFKKLHSSSKSSTASVTGDAADSVSNKRKLPKVLRMFYRKIHPEKPPAEKKFTKSKKYKIMNNAHDSGYSKGDLTFHDEDNNRFTHAAMLKKEITTSGLSHNSLRSINSTGNGEHWIKTDADYLVLEL